MGLSHFLGYLCLCPHTFRKQMKPASQHPAGYKPSRSSYDPGRTPFSSPISIDQYPLHPLDRTSQSSDSVPRTLRRSSGRAQNQSGARSPYKYSHDFRRALPNPSIHSVHEYPVRSSQAVCDMQVESLLGSSLDFASTPERYRFGEARTLRLDRGSTGYNPQIRSRHRYSHDFRSMLNHIPTEYSRRPSQELERTASDSHNDIPQTRPYTPPDQIGLAF